MFSSHEIGSSLVSLEIIFEALRSELFRFKFHLQGSEILKFSEFNLHIVYMNYVVTQMIFIKISKSNKFCVIANKLNFIFSISILPGHEYVTVLITWLTRDCDFSQSRNTIVRYRIYWKLPFMTHMIWLICPKMIALQFWQQEFQIIELRISKNENGTGKCRTYDYHFEYSNGNIITIASFQHRWRFQII